MAIVLQTSADVRVLLNDGSGGFGPFLTPPFPAGGTVRNSSRSLPGV